MNSSTDQNGDIIRAGEQYYQKNLKTQLEKQHYGEIIAIEPISGDYFFGERGIDAAMKSREKYPDRLVYIKRIGHKAVHFVGMVK